MSCLALLILLMAVSRYHAQDMHFMGGTMTYKFLDSDVHKVRVTTVTAWVLGLGPCGRNCSITDVGRSTSKTRNDMLNSKNVNYFGNWTEERHSAGYMLLDINFNVSKALTGEVSDLNIHMGWEQETAEIVFNMDSISTQPLFGFHGHYWHSLDYARREYPAPFRIEVAVYSDKRNDTGRPNNSPVVIFKPVYKVLLNTRTTIILATMDEDGDVVRCRYDHWRGAGGLDSLQKTTVSKDCTVTIDANEADGFTDGGWGAIPVEICDNNVYPILHVLRGVNNRTSVLPSFSSLGRITTQFMIQTLRTIDAPEFVDPTIESQHEFNVYVGSQLKLEFYAKPSGSFKAEVASLDLRSIPKRTFSISPMKGDTSRASQRVMYRVLTWRPTTADVGMYLISALARDTNGSEGPDRNYKLVIKETDFTETVNPPRTGPYISLLPNISGVVCKKDSSCTFPVYSQTKQTGVNISSVRSIASSFKETFVSPPSLVRMNGQTMYVSDVTITASLVGEQQRICLQTLDSNGMTSPTKCIGVTVPYPDPCRLDPCKIGGECKSHGASYTCHCDRAFTGPLCETGIDFCLSNPCVHSSTCMSYPALPGSYACACNPGYTGRNCNIALGG